MLFGQSELPAPYEAAYRGHRVLKRHLPTHHLVPVLSCHNLSEDWEIAARLGPPGKQVEERLNREESPYFVERRTRRNPIPQHELQRNAKGNSHHGRHRATPEPKLLAELI